MTKGLAASRISVLCGDLCGNDSPAWLEHIRGARYFGLGTRTRREYPAAVLKLARILVRERVEILQTHLYDAGLIGLLAARLARTPVVLLTRHYSDQVKISGTRFHLAIDRWLARSANRVIAVSHAVRNHMISQERIDANHIEVVHLGFEFSRLSPSTEDGRRVRTEFGLKNEFVIGCVSSFFRTKGHRYLLIALNELVRNSPDVRLFLVGGGDQSEVRELTRNLGLENYVIFAGHRKDAPACMRAADLVVHPSLSEAFSQVLIETMAVGTPLVSTNVGGASEVITHDETGLLIPAADPSAIVEAVQTLYSDPEKRHRIAAAGQASVRERFTAERMVQCQIAIYESILNRPLKS